MNSVEQAIDNNDVDALLVLLNNEAVIRDAFDYCVRHNNAHCLKHIMHLNNDRSFVIFTAGYYGAKECLAILTKDAMSSQYESAITGAISKGHADCLTYLLSNHTPSDPLRNLYSAVSNGHAQCVKLLIPYIDAPHTDPLIAAVFLGQYECIDLLVPVSDIKQCLPQLYQAKEEHMNYLHEQICKQQRDDILNNITTTHQARVGRKI